MNILLQVVSWLVILFYSVIVLFLIAIGGFNIVLFVAAALPVLILLWTLYKAPSKNKRLYIVLAMLGVFLIAAYFYYAIGMKSWK